MSECIYEIIDLPKYHRKNLVDFCPGTLYRLDAYLDRYANLLILLITEKKCTLSIKPSRVEIYKKKLVVFWKIDGFINTF